MWKTLGKVKRWVLGCAGETSWRVGSAIDLWNKRKFFDQNQIYIVSLSLSLSHPQVHSDIHFVYNFLAASLGKQWPPVKLQNRPTTEKISIFTASCHHKMHTEIALQWKVFRPSRNRFVCTLGVAQLRRRRITLKIKTTAKLFFRFVCCAIKLHMHLSIVTQLGACKKKTASKLHCVCHCDDNCQLGRLATTAKSSNSVFISFSRLEGFTRFGSVFSWLWLEKACNV